MTVRDKTRFLPSMTGLQAFEASARHLSFSRAAEEMNLTQGAISRQIRTIEEQLGFGLFRRVRQRLILTEAGAAYAPEVRACLARMEAATLELLAHQGTGGMLNLAVLPTFGTRWLIPRMPTFWRAHPGITVNFNTRTVPFDFGSEQIDAAIHFGDTSWPGVIAHRLMGEEVVPVCAPALLRDPGLRAIDDLGRHTLLQHTTRPLAFQEWLTAAAPDVHINGLKGPKFEHFAMVIQAAAAGLGVAILPRFLIEEELALARLVIPFDIPVRSAHAYYFVYPEEKREMPVVRTFGDWLVAEARKAGPASAG
jgi:LysR family transcriptional regulator, glycine cleavage system transcriptional activator